jgi:hypothetical protein
MISNITSKNDKITKNEIVTNETTKNEIIHKTITHEKIPQLRWGPAGTELQSPSPSPSKLDSYWFFLFPPDYLPAISMPRVKH